VSDDAGFNSTERFNQAALDMLVRVGNGALVVRMVDLFLMSAPERIASALAAVASDDRRALQLASHSLKSSAGQLGGTALQRASAVVEKMSQTADPEAVMEGIATMEAELALLRDWLMAAREAASTKAAATGSAVDE
jgi:HPt (histidine-containing phosphotransfer) domain-containing protein